MPTSKDIFLLEPTSRRFPQERARKTYEALVEAAAELFRDRGFDATQTPDIAAGAGVSVGTFYRYFSDKKEIFLEIVRRDLSLAQHEVMSRLTPERFAGKERRATIEEALGILVDNVTRRPGMHRIFLEMSLRDEQVAELQRAFDAESVARIAALVGVICPRQDVADPEAAAYVIHRAVVECAIHISGVRGPLPVSRERAVAALSELVYRALFGIERG